MSEENLMNAIRPSIAGTAKLTRAGLFYMLLPALLLGAGVLGWIVMVRAAVSDPSAAIEPDYYRKASNVDAEKAILARSEALGWSARVTSFVFDAGGGATLVLSFTDRDGVPLEALVVDALAFSNVRSIDRQNIELVARGAGTYSARLERARHGIWELRVRARRGSEEFHTTVRGELAAQRSP